MVIGIIAITLLLRGACLCLSIVVRFLTSQLRAHVEKFMRCQIDTRDPSPIRSTVRGKVGQNAEALNSTRFKNGKVIR